MAWTAPPTYVSGSALTAAQLNVLSSDLNETAAAKATAAGQWFIGAGVNSLVARTPTGNDVTGADQGTSSTSFVDLTTVGPAVTVTTGTKALVIISATLSNDTASGYAEMAWTVGSPSNIAVATYAPLRAVNESFAGARASYSKANWVTTLVAGSNTWTAKYRAQNTGTATFNSREIMVLPL